MFILRWWVDGRLSNLLYAHAKGLTLFIKRILTSDLCATDEMGAWSSLGIKGQSSAKRIFNLPCNVLRFNFQSWECEHFIRS